MSIQLRHLLLPLAPLYRLALGLREWRLRTGQEPVRRLRKPVVSIGNLATGGAGKTPLTMALIDALTARGLRVDVLSRGYGRRSKAASRVDPDGSAVDFGDEPLLMARATGVPVYVAAERYEAGIVAEAELDAQLHLLDDGFQHRQLKRDVNILLLSREDWRDRLLPAGNLREPLSAIHRADVIATPASDPAFAAELKAAGWTGPLWRLRRTMEIPDCGVAAAFCGIARPAQFFAGIEAEGVALVLRRAYPDHFPYTRGAVEKLLAEARKKKITAILTTEKDLVRLGALAALFPEEMPLRAVKLRVEIEDQEAAIDWLVARIGLRT
jgi:tetraacyldisaccharide 4'-kinase